MSVKVRVFHPALQQLLGGASETEVDGTTVGECLDDLVRRHPGADKLLFDSRGVLLKPVHVFVNAEGLAKAKSTQPVGERDVLIVATLAVGG